MIRLCRQDIGDIIIVIELKFVKQKLIIGKVCTFGDDVGDIISRGRFWLGIS